LQNPDFGIRQDLGYRRSDIYAWIWYSLSEGWLNLYIPEFTAHLWYAMVE